MNVLFDQNLSPRLATTLDGYVRHDGHSATSLRDKFDPGTPDPVWIEALASERDEWLVISGDVRITRNKAERLAWRQAGLKGFFLKKGWLKALRVHQQAAKLLLKWPAIESLANQVGPGACFEVPIQQHAKFKQLPI